MPFQKGQSGNPGGRSKALKGLEEAARAHSSKAISTLASVMVDRKQPAQARIAAAVALLDRGHGKPTQKQEIAVSADLPSALEAMRARRGESA